MKLTEHFTLEEMTRSSKANALNIDNTPTQYEIDNLTRLCKYVLEPIRARYGKPIIVTSGYRCPKLNTAVGGSNTSQHMTGAAADIKPTDGNVKKLFNMIAQMLVTNQLTCRQLIDEYNYKWIHIAINDDKHSQRYNQILHIR